MQPFVGSVGLLSLKKQFNGSNADKTAVRLRPPNDRIWEALQKLSHLPVTETLGFGRVEGSTESSNDLSF